MRRFAEMVAAEISTQTELEVQVTTKGMPDGSERYGITIREVGSAIAPTIYVDSVAGLPVEEAAREILKIYDENKVDGNVEMDWYLNFEKVKDQLIVRMMPKTYKADVFRSAKAYGFEDLILVPVVKTDVLGIHGTIRVKAEHIERWGVTKRQVIDTAIRNTKKEDVFIESMASFMASISSFDMELPEGPMIISNQEKCYGASAILGKISELKKKNPEGFFVIPSSIHELLIMPKGMGQDQESLDAMVKEVNQTTVAPEEVLSDHAYAF